MVSDKVKSLLAISGKRSVDLAHLFGMSAQSMNNKMSESRFSADDLIRIAEFTGCRLAFILSDGGQIFLTPEDARPKEKVSK